MSRVSIILSVFLVLIVTLFPPSSVYAQGSLSDEARAQREFERERRVEEREELREIDRKPKTAEEVLEMLKERAKEIIAERRRKELLKTQISAGTTYIYETNPSSAVKNSLTPDGSFENTFSMSWVPKFSKIWSGNFGYSLTDLNYVGEEGLGTFDHSVNGDLTYLTFGGKLSLTQNNKHTWLLYPFDAPSSNQEHKHGLSFTHYLTQKWNFGGKYEYSKKDYDKKAARDDNQADLPFHREDWRHTGEVWIKRFLGKYSLKLKAKFYRNKSNDEYQDFNDYDAHQGEITFAGNPFGWEKLYLSASSEFELKQYFDKVAVSTARDDHVHTSKLNLYYTLNKHAKLNFTFQHKTSSSNAAAGEFSATTYKLGTTITF